ncbi:MAG: hypothetical protein ACFHU9_12795 [Fluviicola sp.]
MKGRSIGAVFAGIIAGVVVSYILWAQLEKAYPIEKELLEALLKDREGFREYMRNLPAGYHLGGIGIGCLRLIIGLVIGHLIDKSNAMTLIVIAAFCLLLAILDSFAMPHPVWYGLVYIPTLILIALGFIFMKRRSA